jgi:hypothetical protein
VIQNEKANFEEEGNISFLSSGKMPKKIIPCTISEIRLELIKSNIPTRC